MAAYARGPFMGDENMRMQLFKIKLYPKPEDSKGTTPLLEGEFDRVEILRKRIEERPEPDPFHGARWHIANDQPEGNDAVYFAIGRSSVQEQPKYIQQSGFVVEMTDVAPFTHVLLDLQTCWLGIAQNREVAETPSDIAKHLGRILDCGLPRTVPPVKFEVGEVKDPHDFIDYLQTAHRIRRLTLKVSRPNPIDANEMWQKPFSQLVEATAATSGETVLRGDNLDSEPVLDLVRAVSATGDDASATIEMKKGDRPVAKQLKAQPAFLEIPDISDPANRAAVIGMMRNAYGRIRRGEQDAS